MEKKENDDDNDKWIELHILPEHRNVYREILKTKKWYEERGKDGQNDV